jgi:Acyl-CoA oxidase
MTKAHIILIIFITFRKSIDRLKTKCPKIKENIYNLCRLFALNELMIDSTACYDSGYFTSKSGSYVMEAIKHLLVLLRPQMIPLVEAFDHSDSVLVSAIGNSYGDIYE